MKNETKLNYATLHFAIDDLKLIDEALCTLHKTSKSDNKKDELNRLIWLVSQAINPEVYQYSDSALMNS
jgi:hypothetical protein